MRILENAELDEVSGSGPVADTIKVLIAVGDQLWDLSKGLVTGAEAGWNAAK